MLRLRDYQEQALEAERLHRLEHPEESRLAIVMATGLGKTIIAAERARRHLNENRGGRVLILVHTDELASQMEAKVRLVVGSYWTVGVVKAERDEWASNVIIGSVQTLARPARRAEITGVSLVIVDECHHANADSYQVILRHFGCFGRHEIGVPGVSPSLVWPVTPALGFTATLERGDGRGLGEIWQNVCFSRDISWGVRKGYLVQPVGHRLEIDVRTDFDTGAARTFSESANQQDVLLIDSLAPEKIVEKWLELAKDRPTVAFMPLVRSAWKLWEAFDRSGIEARVISGDMPTWQRRTYLEEYEAGHLQVLVNAMVLTEGWDSPRTKCVIVGRPTKSRPLFVQMAGRGLRPAPGVPVEDQKCILLCVADSTTDLCTVADLSDRKLDRRAQGALTAMEDQWDLAKQAGVEPDPTAYWTGQVDAHEFDPLVTRSSKVWRATDRGTPFLPISKDGEYVFIVGTSVWVREAIPGATGLGPFFKIGRLHKDLPDLELAMATAEDEAQERGGDLGRLLADKARPWRKQVPSAQAIELAHRYGLGKEVAKIMESKSGGKAGRLADLIAKKTATRALEPTVEKIKEATR